MRNLKPWGQMGNLTGLQILIRLQKPNLAGITDNYEMDIIFLSFIKV